MSYTFPSPKFSLMHEEVCVEEEDTIIISFNGLPLGDKALKNDESPPKHNLLQENTFWQEEHVFP